MSFISRIIKFMKFKPIIKCKKFERHNYAVYPFLSCLSVTLVYCGQTVAWIKMKLGMQVGLGPGHIVLDGTQLPLPRGALPPIFGPCLLWQNGWMDQDGTWHGGGSGPGHIVLDGDLGTPPKKGAEVPNFRTISIVAKRLGASRCHLVWR